MAFTVHLLVAILAGWLIYFYLKQRRLPPGPWGLPIIGYLPWVSETKPYITMTKLAEKYGRICSLSMGSVFTVVISDPHLAKKALSRDEFTARANLYLTHGMMEGYGLIAAEGEKWKEQRRFVSSFLKGLGVVKVGSKRAVMEERILAGLREAIKMFKELGGKAEDPVNILLHSLGNVINSIVFGKTWTYDDEQWVWLRNLLKDGVKLIGVSGPINFLPFLRWWPGYSSSLRYLTKGKADTHKVYKEISEEKAKTSMEGEDLLSSYKAAIAKGQGKHFDEKQMYHVLADMFGAGTDTSLNTLRWFLLFIAVHPEIQSRMHEEMDKVMNDRQEPCLEDIPQMPYTMACLAETQRIRSIVPLGIPHGTWKQTEFEGYEIPEGAMIVILQWAMHMDPKVWKDPEIFTPERFIDEDGKFIKKHDHFLPFQYGKRVCVGEEMARMMLFLFGAGLVRKFEISVQERGEELEKALEGISGFTFGPGAHNLIFKPRTRLLTIKPETTDETL